MAKKRYHRVQLMVQPWLLELLRNEAKNNKASLCELIRVACCNSYSFGMLRQYGDPEHSYYVARKKAESRKQIAPEGSNRP
jgi:hypothetical protein